MSVETAPVAPSTPDTLLLKDYTIEDLENELARRRTATEPTSDGSPEVSPFPDPTDSEKAGMTFYDEDSPEKEADDRNRAIDHEILGKAVRVRQDISSKASESVSKVDRLFAQAKNLAGKPRAVIRKWHMDRAEKGLSEKEARLQEKQEKWQAMVDATGSGRLQNRRRERMNKEIENEKLEVASYKTNHLERRQKDYHETVAVRDGRLERSSDRKSKREQSLAEKRQNLIDRKAVALGRKELRAKLRGPENNASKLDCEEIMSEILGDTSEAQLRQLGRDVIGRQLSEGKLAEVQAIRKNINAEEVTQKLTGSIARERAQHTTSLSNIEKGKKDYARIAKVLNSEADATSTLGEFELLQNVDDDIFTHESLMELNRTIQEEERKLEQSKALVQEMEQKLSATSEAMAVLDKHQSSAERNAKSARESVDDRAGRILN